MASAQPAPVDVDHDEQEEFIDQNDIAAEVGDDAEEDHPMDEDDEQEPGGDGQDEIVWEDNSIAQFTAHSSSSSDESKSVFAVAAHPTQPLAVSGGEDDMGYIWDLDSGEQIVKLTGHTDSVAAVGLAMMASWSQPFLTDVQGPDEVVWLRWHPSGNVLAAGSTDSTVWIWNFPSGTPLLVLSAHESPLTAGLFTPNGKRLLSASDSGTLIFTDPRTPTPVFKLTSSDARFGMEAGITAIGVNAASTVAVVGGADGQVRVVNLTKGDVVGALESHAEGESVETIAFVSPAATAPGTSDLELVVTGATDGKIFISDLNTRRLRTTLLGHEDAITSLTVHSDGRLITSSSSDKTLRTWDVRTGECIRIHKGHAGPVMGAAVGKRSTGEEVVVSAGDEGVCLVFPTR
ncbi:WD repeat-containing protein [Ceratobasidium sp. AG-Ba]|nr:WD repeat-containing protein [Ceratobasidium sp. AG-Ba]